MALGIIGRREYDDLDLIRRIRNLFAHAESRISFSTREICDLCDDLITTYGDDYLDAMAEIIGTIAMVPSKRKFIAALFSYNSKLGLYPKFEKFSADFMKLTRDPLIRKMLSEP